MGCIGNLLHDSYLDQLASLVRCLVAKWIAGHHIHCQPVLPYSTSSHTLSISSVLTAPPCMTLPQDQQPPQTGGDVSCPEREGLPAQQADANDAGPLTPAFPAAAGVQYAKAEGGWNDGSCLVRSVSCLQVQQAEHAGQPLCCFGGLSEAGVKVQRQ